MPKSQLIKPGILKLYKPEIMFIPNRITDARYDYTLIEEKIFNSVLFALQPAIELHMSNKCYRQIELFKNIHNRNIIISIPMNRIASPNHYPRIRLAAESLGDKRIRIIFNNRENGKKELRSMHLLGPIVMPIEKRNLPELKIEITPEVAMLMIEMDFNKEGTPIFWTKLNYDVVMSAKNKYTSRVYKIISSWNTSDFFKMSLEEFRDRLDLGDKYPLYAELKRNILLPVQRELKGKAPKWFDCNEKSFTIRVGGLVTQLLFRIITPDIEEVKIKQVEGVKDILRRHARFSKENMLSINKIFSHNMDFARINLRLLEILDYVNKNKAQIEHVQKYIIKSLLKEFG